MITRAPRPTSNFYLLDKAISEDKRLSWASRGLLIFLLGKPDHWSVSPAALVNETAKSSRSMGRDGVYAVLKELKDVGYLHTIGNRNDGGTFAGADYLVAESPYTAFPDTVGSPDTALPDTVEPDTANPTQVSIDPKQGLKKTEKGLKAQAPSSFVLPEWINQSHWDAWHSCDKRKKTTDLQKQMAVEKLGQWREAGIDYAAALENAAIGGWQGLFKPDDKKAAAMTASNHETAYQRSMRLRVAEVSPLLARPAPGAPPAQNATDYFQTIPAIEVTK
jgi:hypothetical protein